MHTIIACWVIFTVSLSLAAPPPPPLGWEATITEGFEPPIEEVLVDHFYADDTERLAHIEAWGEEAVPVLQRLYADRNWGRYRDIVRAYLNLYGAPTTGEPAHDKLRKALEDIGPGASRLSRDGQGALQDALLHDAALAAEIMLDAFTEADASAQLAILRSTGPIGGSDGDRLLRDMRDAAKSEEVRDHAIQHIQSREAAARVDEPIAVILERERGEGRQ
jgi:hypothetical protein